MHQTLKTPPASSSSRPGIITGSQLQARKDVERQLIEMVYVLVINDQLSRDRIKTLENEVNDLAVAAGRPKFPKPIKDIPGQLTIAEAVKQVQPQLDCLKALHVARRENV